MSNSKFIKELISFGYPEEAAKNLDKIFNIYKQIGNHQINEINKTEIRAEYMHFHIIGSIKLVMDFCNLQIEHLEKIAKEFPYMTELTQTLKNLQLVLTEFGCDLIAYSFRGNSKDVI